MSNKFYHFLEILKFLYENFVKKLIIKILVTIIIIITLIIIITIILVVMTLILIIKVINYFLIALMLTIRSLEFITRISILTYVQSPLNVYKSRRSIFKGQMSQVIHLSSLCHRANNKSIGLNNSSS